MRLWGFPSPAKASPQPPSQGKVRPSLQGLGGEIFQAGHGNKAPEVATAPCLRDSQERRPEAGGGRGRREPVVLLN